MTQRPEDLAEFIGQKALTDRLRTVIRGARARGTAIPHILLSGPPGMGKTTLARIVAAEAGTTLAVTSGAALKRPADVVGVLLGAEGPQVVFVDEIHRLGARVEETLYEALEDGTVSVVIGKGAEARLLTFSVPPFVCVGATTLPGMLSAPLRDRFGFHGVMAPYSERELAQMAQRAWTLAGVSAPITAAAVVADRCKGVPRTALHLAERVLDVTALSGEPITAETARAALDSFGVHEHGLDEVDWAILRALTGIFAGRAVGLEALAQALNMDPSTIEREHEGELVRAGYMTRTASGRMAMPDAYTVVRS